MLTSGLFLESPQLPASLFRGWAGKDRVGTNEARGDERKKGEIQFCLRSANINNTHTHCTHVQRDHWDCEGTALLLQPLETNMKVTWLFTRGASVREGHFKESTQFHLKKYKLHSNAKNKLALAMQERASGMQAEQVEQVEQAACSAELWT